MVSFTMSGSAVSGRQQLLELVPLKLSLLHGPREKEYRWRAGVGALVGGGAEALNQYLRTGSVQWGKVGTAALGGAVAGNPVETR
jgi:hypothetical protein